MSRNRIEVWPVEWRPCPLCGATTRHDRGFCYRDPRSPVHHPSQVHTSDRPFRERLAARTIRTTAAIAVVVAVGALALAGCGQSHEERVDQSLQRIEQADHNLDRALSDLHRRAGQ